MSSTYEPLGQTLLEAIACGMRVVAFHRSTGVNTATHELNIDHMVDYADSLDGKGLATAMRNSLNSPSTASPTISAECLDGWDKLWDDLIPAAQ
jgi:glycosyltransferase involved in cell wall biosynthesis